MKIEHLAIWVHDLEKMKHFYIKYFGMSSNEKYVNERKKFSSYFLSFTSGARLELMVQPGISDSGKKTAVNGLTHFAISVGSKEKVNQLTNLLQQDGYSVTGKPRKTGDGYYESTVLDPENNTIEITI